MDELQDTMPLMLSSDYKDRFIAEYWQTKIRYEKLEIMVKKWDAQALDFVPTCPREIYDEQLSHMFDYLAVLEERAKIEKINLDIYRSDRLRSSEDEIRDTKLMRKFLDIVVQKVKILQSTKATNLVITKIQEGVMWLGMHLKELGTPDPYPTSRDNSDMTIHPTADNLKL